jgi:hypothetical protein
VKFLGYWTINPLNTELNPICHLLALLGIHHFLHVSRIRVNKVVRDFFAGHVRGISPVMEYRLSRWLGNVVRMREPPKRSPYGGIRRRLLVEKLRKIPHGRKGTST